MYPSVVNFGGAAADKPPNPAISPTNSGNTRANVRGPPLSSQKYKSFHFSRVESVAEEDYFLDGGTAPSSSGGSFNYNLEAEDDVSLDGIMLKAIGRSQETATPQNPTVGAGFSDPAVNTGLLSAQQPGTDRGLAPKRTNRLVLSPPSLHMSFDVDNAPWSHQQEMLTSQKPHSRSSDNVMHRLRPISGEDAQQLLLGGSGASNRSPTSPGTTRHAMRHHGQPFEIAQISAGYMRTSGAMGQFRGVLSAPMEKSSLLRMNFMRNKQNSKERERLKKDSTGGGSNKNSFSTTTLTTVFGHNQQSIAETMTGPTSVDETGELAKLAGVQSVKKFSTDGNDDATVRFRSGTKQSPLGKSSSPDVAGHKDEEHEHTKSFRLEYHRKLFRQRMKACDYSFGFAVLGIVLMIFETELTAGGIYTKDSICSYGLKTLIVTSTLILTALILAYHSADIRLFMLDHGCDDWRIAIRKGRFCQIIVEVLVCMICPIPGNFYFAYDTGVHQEVSVVSQNDTGIPVATMAIPSHRLPVDILLSIPMFLRLYLIRRLMLLHSKLFTDGPSRSISALNRVNITAKLVLKMIMTMSPVTVLLAFTGSFWLTAAWIMLVCERYGIHPYHHANNGYDSKRYQSVVDYEAPIHQSYLNSIWLVAVTSLTIGYGDIVPNTYCGRSVSIVCGIVGAGTSSLVVAVVAKKLEFSRAEKHVHNFMMDSLITKRMKNAAANVLRETWLIYKNRKLTRKVDASKIRLHQRKFLLAIYELRRTKRGRRKLDENFITVSDMAKTTSMMYEMIAEMRVRQQEMEQKIFDTDRRCANVEAYIGQLQVSICALPELVARKLRPPSPISKG